MSTFGLNVAVADDFSPKIDSIVKDNIDKAGDNISKGVEKLFSPIHKGLEGVVTPIIKKNNAEYYFKLG